MLPSCARLGPSVGVRVGQFGRSIFGSTSSVQVQKRAMSSYNFETLKVTQPEEYVFRVELNRPEKRNAMNQAFWRDVVKCFDQLAVDSDCRVVILTGAGKIFTAGLDLADMGDLMKAQEEGDAGRKAMKIRSFALPLQDSFNSIERCPKPVIAAIHSACVGGGVDMVTACDMRYCTQDSWFQIKEIELGLAADLGTLQRLPKIVGNDSVARELAFTARKVLSDEAKELGLVSRVFPDKDSMVKGAIDTAVLIASKSPIAVQTTKMSMVYSRDHSVADGLSHVLTWNQGMLQSEDVMKAVMGMMEKKTPKFSKL